MCKINSRCPVCGECKTDLYEETTYFPCTPLFVIECYSCGVTLTGSNKELIANMWNRACESKETSATYDPDEYLYREI